MSKLKLLVAAIAVAVLGFAGYNLASGDSTSAAKEVAECGNNAIIRCGAMTPSQLKQKYAANDRGTQAIFSHYNISAQDVANSDSAKIGYVDVNGDVKVDGKVVATNAYTTGRLSKLGGNAVKINNSLTVYEGPDRLKSTLSAYVFFNADGTFKSAVLRVCGNPVRATPPTPPTPPKKEEPKPVYTCDELVKKSISRTEFSFTTKATAKDGATITGYTYDFGDGSSQTGGATVNHNYAKPGNYTVSVSVQVSVNGETKTVSSDNCKATLTVVPEDEIEVCDTETKKIITIKRSEMKDTYTTDLSKCRVEVCYIPKKTIVNITYEEYLQDKDNYTEDMSKCQEETPPTPPTTVEKLPETGIGEVLGGAFGAGALTLAAYYYYVSRRV